MCGRYVYIYIIKSLFKGYVTEYKLQQWNYILVRVGSTGTQENTPPGRNFQPSFSEARGGTLNHNAIIQGNGGVHTTVKSWLLEKSNRDPSIEKSPDVNTFPTVEKITSQTRPRGCYYACFMDDIYGGGTRGIVCQVLHDFLGPLRTQVSCVNEKPLTHHSHQTTERGAPVPRAGKQSRKGHARVDRDYL